MCAHLPPRNQVRSGGAPSPSDSCRHKPMTPEVTAHPLGWMAGWDWETGPREVRGLTEALPGVQGQHSSHRYILIDWLVEVATMKDFSSLCLHLTVECVDRYLRRRLVPRYRLQLLGIACMVICTL